MELRSVRPCLRPCYQKNMGLQASEVEQSHHQELYCNSAGQILLAGKGSQTASKRWCCHVCLLACTAAVWIKVCFLQACPPFLRNRNQKEEGPCWHEGGWARTPTLISVCGCLSWEHGCLSHTWLQAAYPSSSVFLLFNPDLPPPQPLFSLQHASDLQCHHGPFSFCSR